MKHVCRAAAVLTTIVVAACTDAPTVPHTAPDATAHHFAIVNAAWHHDTDSADQWHTLIVHEKDRTSYAATVTLLAQSGERWEYEMVARGASWRVARKSLVKGGAARSTREGSSEVARSTSTTDTIVVGRAGMEDSFGTEFIDAPFAPIEGTVSTLLDAGTNSIDFFEWMYNASGWSQITYDDRTWEIKFESWFPCYNKFFVDEGSGFHCEWVYWDYFNVYFTDSNGAPIEASHAFLTYISDAGEELDTEVATVTVSPDPVYVAYGQTADVTARAYNASQQLLAGKTAEWAVVRGDFATIESTGGMTARITGMGLGSTSLLASVDGEIGGSSITVDPLIAVSGPAYAYDGFITVNADLTPTGGSYYYEWEVAYCLVADQDPYCLEPEYYSGNAGQDEDSQWFVMQPNYEWARFEVEVRPSVGGRVIGTKSWIVDGAGEAPECHRGICPESGGGSVDISEGQG